MLIDQSHSVGRSGKAAPASGFQRRGSRRRDAVALLLACAAIGLSACGQKGPLSLPSPPAKPASAAGSTR
jgi:predicted small lipoprotein YifL